MGDLEEGTTGGLGRGVGGSRGLGLGGDGRGAGDGGAAASIFTSPASKEAPSPYPLSSQDGAAAALSWRASFAATSASRPANRMVVVTATPESRGATPTMREVVPRVPAAVSRLRMSSVQPAWSNAATDVGTRALKVSVTALLPAAYGGSLRASGSKTSSKGQGIAEELRVCASQQAGQTQAGRSTGKQLQAVGRQVVGTCRERKFGPSMDSYSCADSELKHCIPDIAPSSNQLTIFLVVVVRNWAQHFLEARQEAAAAAHEVLAAAVWDEPPGVGAAEALGPCEAAGWAGAGGVGGAAWPPGPASKVSLLSLFGWPGPGRHCTWGRLLESEQGTSSEPARQGRQGRAR